mgnify:CR=1 FL=1
MSSVTGGVQLGLSGGSMNCRNCGHPSHCGVPLREETFTETGRVNYIVICQSCSCYNCSTKTDWG